ncbi:hypothetical protein [Xenorhabdus sp. PB30.3]|uniref:hypothetical protein n=1 Tax=Xenorhabdus sp. PB30.3 TaxID=2788941 RepID=UPI001E573CCE|nr:hypothetical protein [Xenorhabdus sp. PB30.3]MCC8380052.1 hypothetical protein [Xenorhabdus sp. PB30.3]
MSRHQHQLVQSIIFNGEELDLSFLKEATFIETTTLDGPKLIIEYDDKEKYLRDDLAITERDVFTIVLSDPVNLDILSWEAEWVVMTMPVNQGDIITFNLLLKTLYDLKQPSPIARCFVREPVSKVLRQLVPNLPIDVGTFPIRLDFHLLPAQRPSRLIRQMAKELGALVFIRRGTLVFRTLAELQTMKPTFTYHYNDTREKYQIAQYSLPNDSSLIRDLTHRRFVGWDDKKGMVYSGKHTNTPIEHSGVTNKFVLDNLSKIPIPVLDAYMFGNGGLRAGDVVEVVWNRSDLERPIDESLPTLVVIGLVAHSYKGKKLYARIKGILDK